MILNKTKDPPPIHTGSIVLGFSLSLGFGCGLTAGSGEDGKGEEVLLFCAAAFAFIWVPDDMFRTLLPRIEKD